MSLTASATLGRRLWRAANTDGLTFMAAAIAYYALVSVFPLVLLALAIAATLGGAAFVDRVLLALETALTPATAAVIAESLGSGPGRGGATALGLLALLWSGLRLFRGLDVAISDLYGVRTTESFLERVADALVAVGAMLTAVLGTAALGVGLALAGFPAVGVLAPAGFFGVLVAAFLPLYYLLPDVDVTVREVLPGAVFAALGWSALGAVFSLATAALEPFAVYGAVGGVLLLVTWLYVGALVVLLGALLNAIRADRRPDRQRLEAAGQSLGQLMAEPGDGPDGDGAPSGTDSVDDAPVGGAGGTGDADQRDASDDGGDVAVDRGDATGEAASAEEVEQLRRELQAFRDDVEAKTLHREAVESDLRWYVRRQLARGHARGWGPYLVLLYGTGMTIAAFYQLDGPWAVGAMLVIWLSTLGLYVLMLLVGGAISVSSLPRSAIRRLRE
jgi:membrane protein